MRFPSRFLLLLFNLAAAAQSPPASLLYLADLDLEAGRINGLQRIGPVEGYSNQPHFLPGGDLLFTGIYADNQADTYRYLSDQVRVQRLTYTQEGEYSPTLMPGGRHFSVVRVAWDGKQRLWSFPTEKGFPELILPTIEPVGYHLWLDKHRLALFILDEPDPYLAVVDRRDPREQFVFDRVGRCFAMIPNRDAFSAVLKPEDGPWRIVAIDSATLEPRPLIDTLPHSEDYAWAPNGDLLMGSENKLYRADLNTGKWRQLADLSDQSVADITRIAISHNGRKIAFVTAP
jgi:hypothetical protein